MPDYHKVARSDDIAERSPVCITAKGRQIAVVRLDGQVYAVDDLCTHADASLCDGQMEGDEFVCPLHYATFDARTGACTGPPADEDLRTYEVREQDGDVEIRL